MGETVRADAGINQGEMLSLLGTLAGVPAGRIGGWALVIQLGCGAPDCVGLGCESGPLALLSAATTDQGGPNDGEPYILHLFSIAIDEIATGMRDREPR